MSASKTATFTVHVMKITMESKSIRTVVISSLQFSEFDDSYECNECVSLVTFCFQTYLFICWFVTKGKITWGMIKLC